MKKSHAAILCLVTFLLGVITGLFWAAYKGPPPGLSVGSSAGPASMPQSAMENAGRMDQEHVMSALEEFKKKIQTSPDDPGLYTAAGNFLFDHEFFAQAVDYYSKSVELGGGTADVLTDIGICYRKLGKPEKAVEYFKQAIKVNPTHENSALNLGIVLFHDLQDRKGALQAWREYLKMNPQGERADMIRRVVAQIELDLGVEEK